MDMLLRKADLWPDEVETITRFGEPMRTQSCLGGTFGLALGVIFVCLVVLNCLRMDPNYSVRREIALRVGIPKEAFNQSTLNETNTEHLFEAHVAIASLGHHGPCVANGTQCALVPTVTTGDPTSTICTLFGDGTCMINMTMGLQLLGNSVITVSAKGQTMMYNSGWWWEIHINNTVFSDHLLPDGTAVFHGDLSTASTVTMTFLKYAKNDKLVWHQWSLDRLGQTRVGSHATGADFYDEADRLEFSLSTVMSPYHEVTEDSLKETPFAVLMALMGALSGAMGGVGALKRFLLKGLSLLSKARAQCRGKRPATFPGGPGAAAQQLELEEGSAARRHIRHDGTTVDPASLIPTPAMTAPLGGLPGGISASRASQVQVSANPLRIAL
ncbi:hypothetical protein PAPYR_10091 [Paratrimastix pyriformis]|uniref:Transmembrane protein n=1 Tax=Paratrimastix pyriformis TaxID=342808 RepID=A0ABQ8U6P1_9EUKA|nr:hypothetical protein PAPYR_10091 [Paratrimastix pyriformis]